MLIKASHPAFCLFKRGGERGGAKKFTVCFSLQLSSTVDSPPPLGILFFKTSPLQARKKFYFALELLRATLAKGEEMEKKPLEKYPGEERRGEDDLGLKKR